MTIKQTELCSLMTKYRSDKGNDCHGYSRIYTELFSNLRNSNINLFELGIGTNYNDTPYTMGEHGSPGASLRAWKEYFPLANIYSGDIDTRILFEEDRIKTFYVDQKNKDSIRNLWNNDLLRDIEFDIIIDDGAHEVDANLTFLTESFHKLKSGGIYIIEDIIIHYLPEFLNKIGSFVHSNNMCHFDLKVINTTTNVWIWIIV